MRIRLLLATAALGAASLAPLSARADEDLAIVVNPQTGAAAIRNDSDSTIDLNGYLLRAGTDLFDPVAWNSLEEQAIPGWVDGPGLSNRIADTNLLSSSSLDPGETFDLGSPYVPFSPSAFGETEPTFDFTYNVPGVGSFTGDVEFEVQNNVVLVVNTDSGEAMLQNQSVFDVDINAYLVTSSVDALDTVGWSPIAESDAAWLAATGASNRIAEGNLLGSTQLLPGGGSLDLGSPINTALLNDETDLSLQINVPGVGQLSGGVLFVSDVAGIPGDFDGDGDVDGVDLGVFAFDFANSPQGGPPFAQSDFDADGDVDGVDLGVFSFSFANFPASATAIPEPTSLALFSTVAALAFGRRRGR